MVRHRSILYLLAGGCIACGCVALTPAGVPVVVYQAPLDAPPAMRRMPEGCELVATSSRVPMPELDLEGQKDPFRVARNAAGAAGANALLVLKRMVIGRRSSDCPAASPITDCPADFGAWFDVVVESYSCSDEALHQLSLLGPAPERDQGRIR